VENLKPYNPSMLDWEIYEQVLTTTKDLALEAQAKLPEDTILQKKSITMIWGL
jgi:hypothetical protein